MQSVSGPHQVPEKSSEAQRAKVTHSRWPRWGPAMLANADLWLVVLAGSVLALLSVVNVTLGQGLGDRCSDCFLVPTWGAMHVRPV
jgi:hypothetical protein